MINNKILAIVLGGGQGSRLFPLTQARSKPAVPIAGKYRLVDIPISNCLNSDIKRIYVLTQFNSASLNRHIKNTYHFSFFNDGFVDVLAAEQTPENKTWYQGTADAVRKNMHHLLHHDFEYALILSGDQLYHMDFEDMINQHIQNQADISIATLPVNEKEATEFGILKTDQANFITSFIEKPDHSLLPQWTSEVSDEMKKQGRNHLASMGIYIFSKKLLTELMKTEMLDFGKEIIPQSIEKKKVLSYQFEGYWTDIGNIDSFFEANLELTKDLPQFNFFDESRKIYTRPRILPASKISGTELHHTIISEGCIINATSITRSLIGIRSRIGKNTILENTYMMGSDYYQDLSELQASPKISSLSTNHPSALLGIGENCRIKNTITDKNCSIGNDVVIEGSPNLKDTENDHYVIKKGIVIVKKNVAIPDGFKIQS